MNFFFSLYISLWSSLAYNYIDKMDKIPQPKYTQGREYAFVNYNQNDIIVPAPHTALSHFHQVLDELIEKRNRKVNIVHFGDSHIQADYFTDQIRGHFNDEQLLGNGGRGYFFPCLMAQGGYAPYNIQVGYKGRWLGCKNVQLYQSCSWGLSGMTSSTVDSTAQFTIDPNLNSKHKYYITRAKVYYPVNNPNAYNIKVLTPFGAIEPYRLSADGYAEFVLPQPQTKITVQLERRFPNQNFFTLEGVSLENEAVGVQYTAVGVNSATVPSFLKTPQLESHLRSLEPDLVIISLGTNDAYGLGFDENQFKIQYARLIQRVRTASPTASVLLTTPGDCALPGGRWNPSNLKAVRVMKELAEESNCAVWDLFTVMGGYGSVGKWLKNGMTAYDQVHLTGKGYRLQGDLLYDALVSEYGVYCLQKK
jgi:lysophospholipase L1-like esterase